MAENLDFRAAAYGLPRPQARQQAAAYLDRTGLTPARDRLAGAAVRRDAPQLGVIAALLPVRTCSSWMSRPPAWTR